jgi:hypothetical protein
MQVVFPPFEIAEAGEKVEHHIKIIGPEQFAHIVLIELQRIVGAFACLLDAFHGKVRAFHKIAFGVQVDAMPSFAAA